MVISLYQWLWAVCWAVFHPFYVSMVEIQQNTKEGTIEMSVRIFSDDLETTLKQFSGKKIDILNGNQDLNGEILEKYIQHTIQVVVDGKPVAFQYVGHEQQKESIWTYLEVPHKGTISKIEVNCNLLYDFETRQINIFRVITAKGDKSYRLDYPKTKVSFDFP